MGLRDLLSASRRSRSGAKRLRCSFCGSGKDDVPKFISGPDVYICSGCVEVCVEVLNEEAEENPQKEGVFRTESMSFNENQARGALRAFADLVDVVQERFPEEVVEMRFEHQGHVLRLVAELRSGDQFACHYELESDVQLVSDVGGLGGGTTASNKRLAPPLAALAPENPAVSVAVAGERVTISGILPREVIRGRVASLETLSDMAHT